MSQGSGARDTVGLCIADPVTGVINMHVALLPQSIYARATFGWGRIECEYVTPCIDGALLRRAPRFVAIYGARNP